MRSLLLLTVLLLAAASVGLAQNNGGNHHSSKTRHAATHHTSAPPMAKSKDTSVEKQLTQLENQTARTPGVSAHKASANAAPLAARPGKSAASDRNAPINFQGKPAKASTTTNSRRSAPAPQANRKLGLH
jgi:type IV secretory pathway TrbL component